jgi:RNA polymerase sigma-70 factor (ECF subfamily)
MTGDSDAASDIVQETFLRLFKCMSDGVDIRNPKAWLFRVAANLCCSRCRRIDRSERVRRESQTEMHVVSSPEDGLIRREQLAQVQVAIEELTTRERLLVMLYQENLSYAEIAQVTGIRVTSVGKLLSRAIGRLANLVTREELA